LERKQKANEIPIRLKKGNDLESVKRMMESEQKTGVHLADQFKQFKGEHKFNFKQTAFEQILNQNTNLENDFFIDMNRKNTKNGNVEFKKRFSEMEQNKEKNLKEIFDCANLLNQKTKIKSSNQKKVSSQLSKSYNLFEN